MALFIPAFDHSLGCEAYLIDTDREARALELAATGPPESIVEPLLDRTVLMGRSLFDVRGLTFALFFAAGERFTLAISEPAPDGVVSMLRDTLAGFGVVAPRAGVRLEDDALSPLLAYEEGRVSFFDSAATRPWRRLAGQRGLRILAASPTHDPDPDVEIRSCVP